MSFLQFLAGIRNPVFDYIMLLISHLGSPFFVFGVITWFYLNVNKDKACGMTFSFAISCLLCQGIKIIVRAPRPWALSDGKDFTPVERARRSSTGYSFPSVHTQSASSLSLSYMYYYKKKRGRIIALVYLLLIAFSRMYLGVHTPIDVLCGFTVSALVTIIVVHLLDKVGPVATGDGSFLFFLAALSVLLLVLAWALQTNGTVTAANVKDAFDTGSLGIGLVLGIFLEQHFVHMSTEGTLMQKILRFLLAAGVGLGVSMLLKAVLGQGTAVGILRYAFLGLWLVGLAPMLAVKLHLASVSAE